MNPVKQLLGLTKENEELKAKLSAKDPVAAGQSPETLAALITEAVGAATKGLGEQITTIAQSVTALGDEVKAIKAEKADFQAEVGKASALLVAGITGQRPPIKVGEGDPASVSVFDQYVEIKKTDPIGAGRFWKEHRAELRRVV